MENEDMSIDVDEFVDSGIEAAGDKLDKLDEEQGVRPADEEAEIKPETEPETKEQKPAEKETEEAETSEQTESTIAALFKGTEQEQTQKEEEQRVPLEDHIKLRKRAQAAEEKVKELEAQQKETQTEGEDSGEGFLKDHEDDDLVRAGDVRREVGKIEQKAVQKAVGQINQILEQRTAQEQIRNAAINAVQSETQVKKDNPDYDAVTAAANKLGLLSDADRQEILKADNPASKYYELAKSKLSEVQAALGITPTSKKTETTKEETGEEANEEEEMSDEDVFDAVYGEEKE